LVCGFFLKGIIFLSSRSGGFFPAQDMPAISFEAGVGTAGFAQLGVVVGLV